MDAMENLLTRRSCRAYKDEPVSDDAIYNIVRAGLYAPSGMGRQSAIVVVVTDKAVRDQLSRMNAEIAGMKEGDPFYGAPVVLVVLADRTVPTHVEDGALMMGNLLNAAHAEGLGSCWIHPAGSTAPGKSSSRPKVRRSSKSSASRATTSGSVTRSSAFPPGLRARRPLIGKDASSGFEASRGAHPGVRRERRTVSKRGRPFFVGGTSNRNSS